jgi:hypothetical protein
MDTTSNILSLTYTKDYHRLKEILLLVKAHTLLLVICTWGLVLTIGLLLLLIIILRSSKRKHHNNRSKKIIVGGETSSLSGWLTKRRFQQYDQNDNYHGENQPLNKKHRWASTSEESDLSDNEVFNKTDFRNVVLKN